MKSRFSLPSVLTFLCVTCVPFLVHAGVSTPPRSAPFDGGLTLLIAAGVGYASKKAYDKRKKDKAKSVIEK